MISSMNETIPWSAKTHDSFYIVIDNLDSQEDENDASPIGTLVVDVNGLLSKIECISDEEFELNRELISTWLSNVDSNLAKACQSLSRKAILSQIEPVKPKKTILTHEKADFSSLHAWIPPWYFLLLWSFQCVQRHCPAMPAPRSVLCHQL